MLRAPRSIALALVVLAGPIGCAEGTKSSVLPGDAGGDSGSGDDGRDGGDGDSGDGDSGDGDSGDGDANAAPGSKRKKLTIQGSLVESGSGTVVVSGSTSAENEEITVSCPPGSMIDSYSSLYGTSAGGSCPQACGMCTIGAESCTVFFGHASGVCNSDCDQGALKLSTLVLTCTLPEGAHSQFPVLVSLTDGDLADHASAGGRDIYFLDGAGDPLAFERESYDTDTGGLIAWVKLDLTGDDQDFYIYYGGGTSNERSTPQEVWSSGYVAVYHMDDGGSSEADSSGNGNTLTPAADPPVDVAGRIGRALDFQGGNKWLNAQAVSSLDVTSAVTLSAWIHTSMENPGWWETIVSKRIAAVATTNYELSIGASTVDRNLTWYDGNPDPPPPTAYAITDDTDTLVTLTVAGGMCSWYVDGTLLGTDVGCDLVANSGLLYVGGFDSATDQPFYGWIDELRIANAARSSAWVKTEFNNQSDPAAFVVVGEQENL